MATLTKFHNVRCQHSPMLAFPALRIFGQFQGFKKLVKYPTVLNLFIRHKHHRVMALPKVVFVLGGPGAGKGTQCQMIVKKYGFVHLSAGDLLRVESNKPDSVVGASINKHIKDGTIVPVEITCSLLEQAMKEAMAENASVDSFLIDGFPRNKNNLDGWNKQMSDKTHLLFILFFDCSKEVCIQRCLSRGEAGSGRTDDNLDSLNKRIVTYTESTKPIIDHYDGLGLVRKVCASGTPDEVFEQVKKHFDALKSQ